MLMQVSTHLSTMPPSPLNCYIPRVREYSMRLRERVKLRIRMSLPHELFGIACALACIGVTGADARIFCSVSSYIHHDQPVSSMNGYRLSREHSEPLSSCSMKFHVHYCLSGLWCNGVKGND